MDTVKSMSIALYYVGPCLFWLSSSHWKIIDTKVVKMSLELDYDDSSWEILEV